MYFTIKSFKSLTYWNIKFYSIIIKFFKRLHPLTINLIKYNKKILNFIYVFKFNYFYSKFKEKIIDFYNYIKLIFFKKFYTLCKFKKK